MLGEYFSKWVEAWAVPDHTAQTVADKLVFEFSQNMDVRNRSIRIKGAKSSHIRLRFYLKSSV